jgi:hypothetical protein
MARKKILSRDSSIVSLLKHNGWREVGEPDVVQAIPEVKRRGRPRKDHSLEVNE